MLNLNYFNINLMLIDKSKKGKNKTGKILRWKLLNKKNYFKTQLKIWYFYLHTIIVFGYLKKKKKNSNKIFDNFSILLIIYISTT